MLSVNVRHMFVFPTSVIFKTSDFPLVILHSVGLHPHIKQWIIFFFFSSQKPELQKQL